jgi:hypothetical protein
MINNLQEIEGKMHTDFSPISRECKYDNSTTINVITADDEYLIRNSTAKILIESADKLNHKLNILKSRYGIATIKLIYENLKFETRMNLIVSDENIYDLHEWIGNCRNSFYNFLKLNVYYIYRFPFSNEQ